MNSLILRNSNKIILNNSRRITTSTSSTTTNPINSSSSSSIIIPTKLNEQPTAFDNALSSSQLINISSTSLSIQTLLPPLPPPSITPSPDTELLSVLARLIMKSGKLTKAHSHLSTCLSSLSLTTSSPPLPILTKAIEVVSPSIRIVGRRKGTKSLPTPQPLTLEQRRRQAWKWIVEASEKREGVEKVFGKRLALEVLAVLNGNSEAIKKRDARLVLILFFLCLLRKRNQ